MEPSLPHVPSVCSTLLAPACRSGRRPVGGLHAGWGLLSGGGGPYARTLVQVNLAVNVPHFILQAHFITSGGLQVRWQGWDSEGRPVLVVRIAKASEECSGAQADAVATAVISQVRALNPEP